MRVELSGDNNRDYSAYLMAIGDGRVPTVDNLGEYKIQLRDDVVSENNDLGELCSFVCENLTTHCRNRQWLCSPAILCHTNEVNECMRISWGRAHI